MAWMRKRITAKGETRWDVEYREPNRRRRRKSFRLKRDAETFRLAIEADLAAGGYVDPNLGYQHLDVYARSWLRSRVWLSPKTKETYEGQLRLHILPGLGEKPLNRLTPAVVREWYAGLYAMAEDPDIKFGANTAAKCYRLLHAILETAVDDEILRRNPCRIRQGGKEDRRERQIATIVDVFALADVVKPQRRALVLLAAFSGLRLAELLALRRRHIDVLHRRIVVSESTIELAHGELITKAPKSDAGVRKVHLDPVVFEALETHLDRYVWRSPDAYLFTGAKGGQLRRAVWYGEWLRARDKLHLSHLRFHDLRHTHGTLVAQLGATPRETMRRMGHSTVQAAMIYQHATDERDKAIAEALGSRITSALEVAAAVRKAGSEE